MMNTKGTEETADPHQNQESRFQGALAALRDLDFLASLVMWHANRNENGQPQ
jgi:hypothetical protein